MDNVDTPQNVIIFGINWSGIVVPQLAVDVLG